MRLHRSLAFLPGVCAACFLVGCTGDEPLPPPGAHGQALIYLWDAKDGPPLVVVRTAVIEQDKPGDFDQLAMRPAQIRMEASEGVIYITADRGIYRKTQPDTLVLQANRPDGWVRLAGTRGGEPFAGVSTRVVLRQQEKLLTMERVELAHDGRTERIQDRPKPVGTFFQPGHLTSPEGGLLQEWDRIPAMLYLQPPDGRTISGPTRDSQMDPGIATPAITALLAALPHPLALPPVPRGERGAAERSDDDDSRQKPRVP